MMIYLMVDKAADGSSGGRSLLPSWTAAQSAERDRERDLTIVIHQWDMLGQLPST